MALKYQTLANKCSRIMQKLFRTLNVVLKSCFMFQDLYLRITCGGLATALAVTSDGAYCAVATSMMIKIWQVGWLSCKQNAY